MQVFNDALDEWASDRGKREFVKLPKENSSRVQNYLSLTIKSLFLAAFFAAVTA